MLNDEERKFISDKQNRLTNHERAILIWLRRAGHAAPLIAEKINSIEQEISDFILDPDK